MSASVMRGAVADDFTGATDLAGNWTARGLRTSVLLGQPADLPDDGRDSDDAVVVALKTRSIEPDRARSEAVRAGEYLLELGCAQIYDKYCSTFDSTPRGNIGPIADGLLELTGATRAVVVPSFPDNRRTVVQGHLFVGSQLLHESPMKDHPLNPMLDSDVTRLLAPQTAHRVGLVPIEVVHQGEAAVARRLEEVTEAGHQLIVVDAISNEDLRTLAAATAGEPLVTGGSGLALGLDRRPGEPRRIRRRPGRRVVLSGSASQATQDQVAHAGAALPSRRLDIAEYLDGPETAVEHAIAWVSEHWAEDPDRPVLLYTVGGPQDVSRARELGPDVSAQIEQYLAEIAAGLSSAGASEFLIAGGETSGAVLERLGVRRLEVGQQLSAGVSWLTGVSGTGARHNFVLKSGNFGTTDLFTSAWGALDD